MSQIFGASFLNRKSPAIVSKYQVNDEGPLQVSELIEPFQPGTCSTQAISNGCITGTALG